MREVPCTLVVYYPVVSQEVLVRWCSKQEHKVVGCVLGCECTSDESIGDDVASRDDALCASYIRLNKREITKSTHLLLAH